VTQSRPQARNENWAILTINPLPGNPLNFAVVREVLREFLVDQNIRDIQPTHLGQALVRFASDADRDAFVLDSPHRFGDVNISFARHNQGRNWRRVYFNREVRLLLLGFHADYCEDEYVEDVIGPFGRVISWTGVSARLARIIVKARVTDLESIPQFIAFADSPRFEGESWTIQCEIIQYEMLGARPADEDQISVQQYIQGVQQFDFFGLGQQIEAPNHNHQLPGINDAAPDQQEQQE